MAWQLGMCRNVCVPAHIGPWARQAGYLVSCQCALLPPGTCSAFPPTCPLPTGCELSLHPILPLLAPIRLLLDVVMASSRGGWGDTPPPRHGGVEKRGLKALSFTEESQIQGQRQELAW